MSKSRGHKVKQIQVAKDDVFWLSIEEARAAISGKADDQLLERYDSLAERYEQRYPKNKGLSV